MKTRHTLAWSSIVLCLLSVAAAALASGGPALERWVFSSGGGPSQGMGVTLHATLGQAVVGPSAGEAAVLHAGYEQAAPQQREAVYLPLVLRTH